VTARPADPLVGSLVEVDVGPVAHGGHHVARHEGRVIFVRHAIEGERVRVRVTEGAEGARFLRGDAVEVLAASADRVHPPCPYAGPGPDRCGGCDFQHVSLQRQRAMLTQVVTEQLRRLAGVDVDVEVEPVPGDVRGLGWRTRVRWSATNQHQPGLLAHRSSHVVPVDECLIAHPDLPRVVDELASGAESATAVVSSTGEQVVVTDARAAPMITEEAAGRFWRLHSGDFWQVHPGAADVLVEAVLRGAAPQPGERCWDLYAGVGLFTGVLADAVGGSGAVVAVESHRRSVDDLRQNVAETSNVRALRDRVDRFVRSRQAQGRLDVVVMDPPRSGAGRDVVRRIAARKPRVVVYVACDPAALARDVATFRADGFELSGLRAFDIFPMTHHVECVALLEKTGSDLRRSDSR
jgi:tRNA/tmRNA/rRNA uracil-C5-methylase (TrmA/RlmC/RlmD family)